MQVYTGPITRLIEEFSKLPGVGRKTAQRLRENKSSEAVTLDDLFAKINEGLREINVIIKADVNGSSEAVKNSL